MQLKETPYIFPNGWWLVNTKQKQLLFIMVAKSLYFGLFLLLQIKSFLKNSIKLPPCWFQSLKNFDLILFYSKKLA